MEYPVSIVKEGLTKIMIPDLASHLGPDAHQVSSRRLPVFYNPRMEFNRDLSIVVLNAYAKNKTHEITIIEPLTGTGIRGIRYAIEVPGIKRVIIGDQNPTSIDLAKKNILLNKVSEKVILKLMDANLHLSNLTEGKEPIDVIDLDPFGSPAPFLDSAARVISKRNGLLCITATDMPNLVGINKYTCLRKYGVVPLKTWYAHETAVRILIAASVLAITRHGHGAKPILTHSTDHYVRIYIAIQRGKENAKKTVSQLGYLRHCDNCFTREVGALSEFLGEYCPVCGETLRIGGPFWIGELANRHFVRQCINEAHLLHLGKKKDVITLLQLIDGELEIAPTYFDLHLLSKKLKISSPPLQKVITLLRKRGYKAARTHFKYTGFRTDASASDVLDIVSTC